MQVVIIEQEKNKDQINMKLFLKNIIIICALMAINSCKQKDENVIIESNISIVKDIAGKIESKNILFDTSIRYACSFRENTITLAFKDSCGFSYAKPDKNENGNIKITKLCNSLHNKYNALILGDTLLRIFEELNLVSLNKNYNKDYNSKEENVIEFITYISDSTFRQVKYFNNSFYDNKHYIDTNTIYKYVLAVIKTNDKNKYQSAINYLTKFQSINKLSDKWYYYRTFEF